jgi:hypothetical protein
VPFLAAAAPPHRRTAAPPHRRTATPAALLECLLFHLKGMVVGRRTAAPPHRRTAAPPRQPHFWKAFSLN